MLKLLIIREMQIKTTMKSNTKCKSNTTSHSLGWLKSKGQTKTNWQESGKMRIPIHSWWEHEMVQPFRKAVWQFLKRLSIHLPCDPAILLPDIYPREKAIYVHTKILYMNVHSSLFVLTQSCPTLCDPMNRTMPGLPVHHQLLEFTQTHVHQVGDVIQPSHPLSSRCPPAPNPSQHQSLFQWVNSSHEMAKVLEFQL